jgi:hypothetical protein
MFCPRAGNVDLQIAADRDLPSTLAVTLVVLLVDPEDGSSTFFRNND